MKKQSSLTYFCDIICSIHTGAIHWFKWDSSVYESYQQTSVQLKKSTLIVVRHFLSAKVSPEWRSNSGFGTQNKSPFPLNRGVPSIEVTNTKIMWKFSRSQIFCPLKGVDPWIEVSQRRGSTVYKTQFSPHLEHCCFLTLFLLFSEHFLASRFVENPSTVVDAEKIVIEAG